MAEALAQGRGLIVKDLNDRLREIERCGCPKGQVQEERILTLRKDVDSQSETNAKLFGAIDDIKALISAYAMRFLVMMMILAVLAGINVASILHLIPK